MINPIHLIRPLVRWACDAGINERRERMDYFRSLVCARFPTLSLEDTDFLYVMAVDKTHQSYQGRSGRLTETKLFDVIDGCFSHPIVHRQKIVRAPFSRRLDGYILGRAASIGISCGNSARERKPQSWPGEAQHIVRHNADAKERGEMPAQLVCALRSMLDNRIQTVLFGVPDVMLLSYQNEGALLALIDLIKRSDPLPYIPHTKPSDSVKRRVLQTQRQERLL